MAEDFERFTEEWEINMGKEKYVVNERQHALLEQAVLDGQRGMVVFDGLAISIPHIQSMYRLSRKIKPEYQLSEPEIVEREPTEAEKKRHAEFMKKLRADMVAKGILKYSPNPA